MLYGPAIATSSSSGAPTGTAITSVTGDIITGAAWDRTKTLYIGIDNESGNDSNAGGVVATTGSTFTTEVSSVAWKTEEHARAMIPRYGNGCKLVVLIKPRSDGGNFLKQDGVTNDWLDWQYGGYAYIMFRGSADLTNGTNDTFDLGGVIEAGDEGPAAGNKWTVSSQASFAITNAAGTLPSADTIAGKKLRFDGNITSALRTTSRGIADRTGATVLDMGRAATAANGDLYQINTPGVKFTTLVGTPGINSVPSNTINYNQGIQLVGFRFTAATNIETTGPVQLCFARFDAAVSWVTTTPIVATTSYINESGTVKTIEAGIDAKADFALYGSVGTLTSSAFHSTSEFWGNPQITASTELLRASYCTGLVTIKGFHGGPSNVTTSYATIGGWSATFHAAKFVAGANITDARCGISRISLDGATAGIALIGTGYYNIDTITGALASTVNAFTMSSAVETTAQFGSAVACTESAGGVDILMGSSVTATFASLATSPQYDENGNSAARGGLRPVKRTVLKFSGDFIGAAGAKTDYLADSGPIAGSVLDAVPVSYPMPACRVRNLRIQATVNPLGANLVCRVLKNGAATGITATITTGSTALFSDLTHEGQFAAGDVLDIDMTETGAGTAKIVATLECF